MAEQRITTKPTVDALLENDYIFIDHDGALRRVRKSDADIVSGADLAGMAASLEQFEESVSGQIDAYAIINTANGSIASFSDGADNLQMKSLKVSIIPKQDLHGYDRPWIGGGGKNVLENKLTTKTRNGVTITVNADKTITLNGTCTGWFFENINYEANTVHFPSGNYIFNGGTSGAVFKIYNNGSAIATASGSSDVAFTIPENPTVNYVRIEFNSGVTFNNTVVKPMVRLASIADSTYEPYENICPIEGWTDVNATVAGKNFLENKLTTKTRNGITITVNADKSVTLNGTCTGWFSENINYEANTVHFPKGSFIFNGGASGAVFKIYNNGSAIATTSGASDVAFTIPENPTVNYARIEFNSGVSFNNVTVKPMVRATGTDATYEPYIAPTTTPVPLGQTVYGGEVDVVSGVLKIDRTIIDLATSQSGWYMASTMVSGKQRLGITIEDIKANTQNVISNILPFVGGNGTYAGTMGIGTDANPRITLYKDDLQTVNDWKAWATANSLKVCYELATPTTVQLTPTQVATLLGTNNVWSDAGGMEVSYTADPKIYIDNKFAELQALILENN